MSKNYDEIQNNDFDTLLRLMLKFNCLIQQDDICDVIDCSRCPFDLLSPETEDGDVDTTACTNAMAEHLEKVWKEL